MRRSCDRRAASQSSSWRLRECDFAVLNGTPAREMQASRRTHIDEPFPRGESWRQAIDRVGRFLNDITLRWDDKRILVVGHVATKCAFDHFSLGLPVDQLIDADFEWRPGWEYIIS